MIQQDAVRGDEETRGSHYGLNVPVFQERPGQKTGLCRFWFEFHEILCENPFLERVGCKKKWWRCLDLNQGHYGYEPYALTN